MSETNADPNWDDAGREETESRRPDHGFSPIAHEVTVSSHGMSGLDRPDVAQLAYPSHSSRHNHRSSPTAPKASYPTDSQIAYPDSVMSVRPVLPVGNVAHSNNYVGFRSQSTNPRLVAGASPVSSWLGRVSNPGVTPRPQISPLRGIGRVFEHTSQPAYHSPEMSVWHTSERLVDDRKHLNSVDASGQMSLHMAAVNGLQQNARLLLDSGARIEDADGEGRTPLHLAALNGGRQIVSLLLDRGANVDARDTAAATPLHLAAKRYGDDIARLLLDRGAHIEHADGEGRTPLHLAVSNGRLEIARLLLDRGAHIDDADGEGRTPLHLAVQNGRLAIARLLLDRGAHIDDADGEGRTPLHLAVSNGRLEIARLLLDREAHIDDADGEGRTPLHLAALNGCQQNAKLLLDRGANVDARDTAAATPLHLAALYGHEQVARLLLDSEADVEHRDRRERTPLHLAALNGHQQVARLLLDRCANLDAQDADAASPLSLALQTDTGFVVEHGCRKGVVAVLLYFNARPEPSDLETAAHAGQFDIVRMLLAALGDVGTRSTRPADKTEGKAIIEAILAESLESIAVHEFSWLKDLVEEGVTFAEVAGMLLTDDSNAEHAETESGNASHPAGLRPTALPHLKNCLHDYGFDLHVGRQFPAGQCSVDPLLEGKDSAFFTNPTFVSCEQQTLDHEIQQVFRRIWKPMLDATTTESSATSAVVCYVCTLALTLPYSDGMAVLDGSQAN